MRRNVAQMIDQSSKTKSIRMSMMLGLLYGNVSMVKTAEQSAIDNYQKGKC
jgi:hypothetical protein